eukprot:5545636-Amphidinium_carterae.1
MLLVIAELKVWRGARAQAATFDGLHPGSGWQRGVRLIGNVLAWFFRTPALERQHSVSAERAESG